MSEQLYIPYSSWDDANFFIGRQVFGRDFTTADEAQDYGAIFLGKEKMSAACALYDRKGSALTWDEVHGTQDLSPPSCREISF